MSTQTNWVDGLFISEKDGQYGKFLSIGVKKDQFIEYLKNQKEDAAGFINMIGSPRKGDASKFSVKITEFKKLEGQKPSEPAFVGDAGSADDDLPF